MLNVLSSMPYCYVMILETILKHLFSICLLLYIEYNWPQLFLTLHRKTLLLLLISPNSLLMILKAFYRHDVICLKGGVFCPSFPICKPFSFTLARTPGTMLNKTRNYGHLCLPPSLRGKAICPLSLWCDQNDFGRFPLWFSDIPLEFLVHKKFSFSFKIMNGC